MGEGSPLVGLQAQSPDVLGKLSQLLTIRQQRAQVQQTEQDTTQRAALAKFDFSPHIGDDGTFDLNSIAVDPQFRAAAGDYFLDNMAKVATAKQMQLDAKSKLFSLRGEQVAALGETLGPLLSDPDVAEDNETGRQKVNEAWMQYGRLFGNEALPVLSAYAPALKGTPKGQMRQTLRMIQMQATSAAEQMSAQQPQYLNTGAEFEQVNPLNVSPSTPTTGAAPSARRSIPTTIAPNTPLRYPGQQEDIKRNQEEVASVRTQADQAPQQRSIYKKILELSDDTNTGQLVSWFQKNPIVGQLAGDDYQELGKYLEKNAIANMQAMGAPGSDARLAAASAANGSTQFNAKALKAVTQFNYATNTALEQYRRGVDKAVGTANPDYTRLADFKSQWAQNFDIDVFRIENAERDGDNKALATLREEILRKPGKARELQTKRRNLEALSTGGKLQ